MNIVVDLCKEIEIYRMFAAVVLNTKQKLVVSSNWFRRIDGNSAIIFHSKNANVSPVFAPIWRHFDSGKDRSYYGAILRDKFSESLLFV